MAQTKASPDTRPSRILLVDDDEFLLDVIREILEEAGYEVAALARSIEALRIFSEAPSDFDLVLTDEKMAELSGSDLSEQILKLRPDIPIVLHTDYPDAPSTKRARDIGVRAILAKSLNANQLITVMRSLLGR